MGFRKLRTSPATPHHQKIPALPISEQKSAHVSKNRWKAEMAMSEVKMNVILKITRYAA